MGRVIYPDEGVKIKIVFGTFSTFKIFRNDTLKVVGNYIFEGSQNGYDKINYSNIVTYNYNFYQTSGYAQIHSDTLSIWDGAYDGFTDYYKKIY
jgi:hypothetical protein